jgi:DNA polymerase-3 subunit gamma/tau
MNHQTLYRKYRPANFDEVKGQTELITLFKNVLAQNKLGHAYLFVGGRGTGKTSVARILVSELKTSPEDIYEIDAASNRGIDEIRALRDGVSTLPFSSKYKVYIIDEAHMLTIQAANALLKTLEEPPAHCIFILATTDPEKLPRTIVSRCQTIEFKKADTEVLEELIQDIASREGYTIDSEVVSMIARQGDGSYRDTYGILEKAFALFPDKKITKAEYSLQNKTPAEDTIISILERFVNAEDEKLLDEIRILEESSVDARFVLEHIISSVREALLLRFDTSGEYGKQLTKKRSSEAVERLKKIGLTKKRPITADILVKFIDVYTSVSKTTFAGYMLLEAAFLQFTQHTHEENK